MTLTGGLLQEGIMKITDFMKRASLCDPESACGDVGLLLDAAVSAGRFPSDKPLPRDCNAVSRYHADILNGQRIELAAITQGFDRALWIHAADAAFLGLEPRGDPLRLAARNAGKGGVRFSLQNVYLIDQFSDASLSRLYAWANPAVNREYASGLGETALRVRNALAVKSVYAIAQYDTGILDAVHRTKAMKNYRENTLSVSGTGFALARDTHRSCLAAIPPPGRSAFEYLRKYHAQQLTALQVIPAGSANNGGLRKSFDYLARNPGEALRTVFYSRLFAARLCNPEFAVPYPVSLTPASSMRENRTGIVSTRRETPVETFIGR
jgi:hypothetical protein